MYLARYLTFLLLPWVSVAQTTTALSASMEADFASRDVFATRTTDYTSNALFTADHNREMVAQEEILVSTFKANTSSSSCCGWGTVGPSRLAYPFTVAGTSDVVFTGASLLLSKGVGQVNAVDISLASDASGTPGAVLETFHVVDKLLTPDGGPIPPIRVISSLRPVLTRANVYWLIVSPSSPGSGVGWGTDFLPTLPSKRAFQSIPSFSWESVEHPLGSDDATGAFRVYTTRSYADVVGVTPTSGSGDTGSFRAVFRHSGGTSQHYLGYMLFLPLPNVVSFNARGTCLVEYNRLGGNFDGRGGMRLIDDQGTGWLGPVQGVAVGLLMSELSNGTCEVDVRRAQIRFSETDMIVDVTVRFKAAAMTEVVGTFLQSNDVNNHWSEFRQFGNWTLGGGARKPGPYIASGVPASGVGVTSLLSISTGHTAGVASLAMVHVRLNSVITGGQPCHVVYWPSDNSIALLDDEQTGLVGPSQLGAELKMSRCGIQAGASRLVSGNNLQLNLPLSFDRTNFRGAKNVYVNAFDTSGALTHWVQTGTWTVE